MTDLGCHATLLGCNWEMLSRQPRPQSLLGVQNGGAILNADSTGDEVGSLDIVQYSWISFKNCLLTIQEKVKMLYLEDTVENCAFSLRDLSVTWASISRVIIIRPLSSPGTTVLSSDIQNRLYMYCLRYKPLGDQKRIDPIHVQLGVASRALMWRGGDARRKKSLLDQSGG